MPVFLLLFLNSHMSIIIEMILLELEMNHYKRFTIGIGLIISVRGDVLASCFPCPTKIPPIAFNKCYVGRCEAETLSSKWYPSAIPEIKTATTLSLDVKNISLYYVDAMMYCTYTVKGHPQQKVQLSKLAPQCSLNPSSYCGRKNQFTCPDSLKKELPLKIQ